MSIEPIYVRRRTPDYTMEARPLSSITLYEMAEQMEQRALAAFTATGVKPPARQVIYLSPIPADCEQLAVMFSGWVPFPPWEGMTSCSNFRWCGIFTVAITRVTPAMGKKASSAPTPQQMRAAAQIASQDAEVLLHIVNNLGEIGQDMSLETGAPEGGLQSTVLVVQVPAFGGLE